MLTTVALIKSDWLNISDSSKDTLLTSLIGYAGSMIKTYCNQPIEQETVTLYFEGNDELYYKLPYTVPVTLTSLSYRTLPSESFTADSNAVIWHNKLLHGIYTSSVFSYPYYKAVLSVGYSSIPSDIVVACSELVVDLFNETGVDSASRIGVSSISKSQGGVTETTNFSSVLSKVKPTLDKYKLYVV